MIRKSIVIILSFTFFLSACIPVFEDTAPPTTIGLDYYSDIVGDWTSPSRQLYLMNGVTITFSDDLQDIDKRMWLLYLGESIGFLPDHQKSQLNGLLISFNSGNACIENNYLACFTRHNFSIFFSTTKQESKRGNIKTILHEIGHAIDERFKPREASFSEDLHKNKYRPTFYAGSNAFEDFAESFAIYILSPSYFNSCCNARYEFMRDSIFLGKEYFNK